MKFKYLIAAAAATCLTSTMAQAQDGQPTGFYVGANAGIAMVDDVEATLYDVGGTFGGAGARDTLVVDLDFKDAATFGGVAGYDFGMFRTDVEFSYARNRLRGLAVDRLNGTPVTLTPGDRQDICDFLDASCAGSGNSFDIADGPKLRQLNAMANAWIDLPLGGFTPYVGGGLGISNLKIGDEDKTRFAWQLGAGAAFQLTPAIAITADYRHRQTERTQVEFDSVSGIEFGKVKSNTVTLGLRAYFGGGSEPAPEYVAPPPPPPPPPPPSYEPAPPPPPPPAPRPGERG